MKFAVHLHLYYLEQLSDILQYLHSLKGQNYDLFVTMVTQNETAEKNIKAFKCNAKVMIVPNVGYDLGPFIEFLHKIDLDAYNYILKIHTKGNVSQNYTWLNGNRLDNKLWKEILFDALLKNKERVEKNLALLECNSEIGMLSSKYCITDEKKVYQKLLPQINTALKECGFNEMDKICFVAGTMFWVRAKLMKPLLKYTIRDFDVSDARIKEGTFAHVVERLLGALMISQGYSIYGIKHDNYTKGFLLAAFKRFIYQKKRTNTGYTIIKICRIPIWHQRGLA